MTAGDSHSNHYEGKDFIIKTEARALSPLQKVSNHTRLSWHYLINQPFA